MADKKAILVVCGQADIAAGPAMDKFMKKAVTLPNFDGTGLAGMAGAIEGAAVVAADEAGKIFEDDGAFVVVELGDVDGAALEAAMTTLGDAADRRTLTVLATSGGLYLSGMGMNKKAGSLDRGATAADVVATLCYVADLPVPADCMGAVLYQALKDPNMKMKEVAKLKEAIGRMEVALQRDTREPWDKHDCA
ncbi:hypothetical protein GM415_17705 [Pseudodesulfovibrio cashew]|uniref:Uncharacterized protein n=1 Tax=Pseudodesulfovibrio cashew TaxID=2678688 RepID=A0A6I6JLK1_9BACT|nr:hypothetical protein [Pseudodesulfovibrio cashew]QGY41878.1 hypothetical protein GM415_17705 [Pseudodesulfovibrio cashew]